MRDIKKLERATRLTSGSLRRSMKPQVRPSRVEMPDDWRLCVGQKDFVVDDGEKVEDVEVARSSYDSAS